jgi:DNA polymerase elongation subunit (family B)
VREKIHYEKILFLDIETVPQTYDFHDLDATTMELFDAKTRFQRKPEVSLEEMYQDRAGILAEFGKIVCISVGFVHQKHSGKQMRLKSFYHSDEETLLRQFKQLLDDHYGTGSHVLCGHNIKEFDVPYICRRMIINGLSLPDVLNVSGRKPWEINHMDTMEMWKFGDYKAYTSLALLCHVFNIPTPKDDISGADVARVYYEEGNLDRIKTYCEKDVAALIQLFLKMKGEALIPEGDIQFSS